MMKAIKDIVKRPIAGSFLLLASLAIGSANAQPFGRPQAMDQGGLKDAYKNYFSVGVAVNRRNIGNPDEVKIVLESSTHLRTSGSGRTLMLSPTSAVSTRSSCVATVSYGTHSSATG